jgi:cell division protein FtsI (penicillin-binding protein 3)
MIRPEDGYDIQTTIDIDLQEVADRALRKALIEHEADYGSVVMMEVQTGEIKAVVNLSRTSEGNYLEDNNYAIGSMGLAEPGSTIKIATMAALLEETDMRLTDTVQTGNGKYEFSKDAVMTDASAYGHGKISVKEVFEKSSNIGLSKLVALKYFRKNPEKFLEYFDRFNLTKPIEFQMSGGAMPIVSRPGDRNWSGVSLPWMSVGYELKLSPLHILTFCNALANSGKMMQPFIVKRILQADRVVEEISPKVLNAKVCSDKTLTTMRELMEGVVARGTASNIKTDLYKIAGKTGTAEKVENGSYTEKHYTSFVGYFPSDAPRYSCIVVIDNPKVGRYAAQVSAPVFKEVADFAYKNRVLKSLDIANLDQEGKSKAPVTKAGYLPDIELICKELGVKNILLTNENWVFAKSSGDTLRITGNPMQQDIVPNVMGMTLKDALFVLENKGMKVVFSGRGKVVAQSITAGTKVHKGGKIIIRLS